MTFTPEHWCSSPMCHMLCQECGHRGWKTPGSHEIPAPLKSPIHLPEGPCPARWHGESEAQPPPLPALRHCRSGAGLGFRPAGGERATQIWARATARESRGAQGTRGGFPGRRGGWGGSRQGSGLAPSPGRRAWAERGGGQLLRTPLAPGALHRCSQEVLIAPRPSLATQEAGEA